jgi:glycosyltransferase involved in cell wall biosynthesis
MDIHYLSHGTFETGGYRHELFFAEQLSKKYKGPNLNVLRAGKFQGIKHLSLQFWAWKNATADINIVVGRIALIVILRNLFTKNRTFIVLHNFDTTDGKSFLLNVYYSILFFLIKRAKSDRIKIVAVSPFFKNYFENKLGTPVTLFPNFFDTAKLNTFKTIKKENRIHLGLWSGKNSNEIFKLAELLSLNNYSCYFSTLEKQMEKTDKNYSVICFETYELYLRHMAESKYSIAFPSINEGWNRVSHESILVGTPVIGFNKGGLGDLLKESNMLIVNNAAEALELILGNTIREPAIEFIKKYDIENAINFLPDNFQLFLYEIHPEFFTPEL